jgi:Tfp pilus assembly protein PilF
MVSLTGTSARYGNVCELLWIAVYPHGGRRPAVPQPSAENRRIMMRRIDKRLAEEPAGGAENARLLAQRALLHAQLGEFEEATADFKGAITLNPNDQYSWYRLAGIRMYIGDEQGYRALARDMLDHFGTTMDPGIANSTLKTCLLIPETVGDPELLQRLFKQEVNARFVHWTRLNQAMLEFRTGQYKAAAEHLADHNLGFGAEQAQEIATVELLLAMSYQHLGRSNEAAEVMRGAVTRIETQVAKPGDLPVNFENWLICQIILREACNTIPGFASKAPATRPSSRPASP